jgi:hypothetical protein
MKQRYNEHKQNAAQRGVGWEFTYDTWLDKWETSGHLDERGDYRYVMARYGDRGPYSPTNTKIITHAENVREAHVGVPKPTCKAKHLRVPVTIDGVTYESQSAASRETGILQATISYRMKSGYYD